MKYIKLFLLGITTLFIVMWGLSLMIPSHIKISRAINLASGNDSVLFYINDLAKWKQWYPGFEKVVLSDTQMNNGKIVAAKADGILLQMLESNDTLVTVQMIKNKRPVNVSWKYISHASNDSATLHNYMDFHVKWYPWEKLASLVFDKSYGPIMEQGLLNLKKFTQDK